MPGIHRERPGADAMAPADGSPARPIADGVWMSSGLSNSYLLTTDAGRIVVNTGMGFEGPLHRRAYDAVAPGPTHTILLTQGHYDHVGGVDTFRDAATEVVMHADYAIWRADNERLETFRSRNAAFAWIDAIVAAMEHARSLGTGAVAQSRPEPTRTFTDTVDLEIGGRRLTLISVPGGETTDSMVIWSPEDRTAFTGNMFGPLFGHVPNLVTIRGDRYRDALDYIASLERVLALAPARLVTGHFDPIDGEDRIAEEIIAMRDAMAWVHDRTVDGMNEGRDVHTLMREITTPSHLDVGEGYGRTAWNVRAIWEHYAGWFHHRSTTELYGVPAAAVAPDIVRAAGADALAAAAADHLAAGRPVEAIHLTDLVLTAVPDHTAARRVAIDAHGALLGGSRNFWEAAWLRRSITKLGGTP
ncbi:MAG: MBL fold metallo-hydrolase [Actinomycetes bacterium]